MKRKGIGVLDILGIILIGLKVTGNSSLTWRQSFIPFIIEWSIIIIMCIPTSRKINEEKKRKENDRLKQMDEIFKNDGI